MSLDTAPSAPLRLEPEEPGDDPYAPPAWSPLSAVLALIIALVAGTVGGALVAAIIGLLLGLNVGGSTLPPGLVITATAVQDAAFVLTAVVMAQRGGRRAYPAQFGLRTTAAWPAIAMIIVLYVAFLVVTVVWQAAFNDHTPEKLLNELGTNESAVLLVFGAILTCVIAPFCEEFLFRGYIFTALRNWRGPWPAAVITGLVFGGVHVLSAPFVDIVPLAFFGFGLCVLYWRTRSLLPGIATHCVNNSFAFAALEHWAAVDYVLLVASALAVLGVAAVVLRAYGLIVPGEHPALAGA
jgi:membrane protease YdiL (CAAX protease family)